MTALDYIASVTATVEPEGLGDPHIKAPQFITDLVKAVGRTALPSTDNFKFVKNYVSASPSRPNVAYSIEVRNASARAFVRCAHIAHNDAAGMTSTVAVVARVTDNSIDISIIKAVSADTSETHSVRKFVFNGLKPLAILLTKACTDVRQEMTRILEHLEHLYTKYAIAHTALSIAKDKLAAPVLNTKTVFSTACKEREGSRYVSASVYLPATGHEYVFEVDLEMHMHGIDDYIIPEILFSMTVRTEIPSPIDKSRNIKSISVVDIAKDMSSADIVKLIASKYRDFVYILESRLS